MASLYDILTTTQNGVIAINNFGRQLVGSFNNIAAPWTPYTVIVTASAGTFTTVSATGRFHALGKTVFVGVVINVTTNGTANGFVVFNLPLVPGPSNYILSGRENFVTGKMLQGVTSGASCLVLNYDNTYPGGNGTQLIVSGVYEAA